MTSPPKNSRMKNQPVSDRKKINKNPKKDEALREQEALKK